MPDWGRVLTRMPTFNEGPKMQIGLVVYEQVGIGCKAHRETLDQKLYLGHTFGHGLCLQHSCLPFLTVCGSCLQKIDSIIFCLFPTCRHFSRSVPCSWERFWNARMSSDGNRDDPAPSGEGKGVSPCWNVTVAPKWLCSQSQRELPEPDKTQTAYPVGLTLQAPIPHSRSQGESEAPSLPFF